MNKFFILFIFLAGFTIYAQQEEWRYIRELKFPEADSGKVQPFLCTVDSSGRLYVASSKVTNANAHNAIYYADPGDTVMKKFIDFDANGDSDTLTGNIAAIRGITAIGRDLFINANIPFQRVATTVSCLYRYPNADTLQVEKFGFNINGSGYGTYVHGMAATRDSIIMSGITFNTSIRFYNFSNSITSPARGSWVPITGAYPMEPGGPQTGGYDVIRDVATVPNADYTNPEVPFYTSRNSLSSTNLTGGIAIWTGGSQLNPGSYVGTRLSDAASELAFDNAIAYGITVDKNGLLWVAGIDSTRRWVKAYQVTINFAQPVYSLPALYDPVNPDPNGAPMRNPADVSLTKDAKTAYVIDAGASKVFKFQFIAPSSVDDFTNELDFVLYQNFPNPFNPNTFISFKLHSASNAKLFISNALGEVISVVTEGYLKEGLHTYNFDATNYPSGIYYYTLVAGNKILTRKMALLK